MFMDQYLAYLLANEEVAGFNSPRRQVAMALTYIQGPRVERWRGGIVNWLRGLDPADNAQAIWDHFAYEFRQQFADSTGTQRARQKLDTLKFRFPDIDQYVTDFEDLASEAGYTVGNEETLNLFLKGFDSATDILDKVWTAPFPETYGDMKERAINAVKGKQLINAIKRNAFGGGLRTFQPPRPQPFFQRNQGPQQPQRQWQQRQYNSSNAPRAMNNVPVPMDISNRSRAMPPRNNWNARGNTAQTDPDWRKNITCFKCGKTGHMKRECRSKQTSINYMDQDEEMGHVQTPISPQNILDNALKAFDQLPLDQKDAFIQKYEGGAEDFPVV
jgi:hypothetical protein